MHTYCLFCQTQKAAQVVNLIESIYPEDTGVRCISPRIVQRCWVKGKEELRVHDYLPGYLFLYTEDPIKEFVELRRVTGVIRLLGERDDGYELVGADRDFAEMLHNMDGTIGIMKTVKVGDRVQLDKSIYKGFTGEVIRVDRRKGRCQIRFEFDKSIQNVWVGYEVVVHAENPTGGDSAESVNKQNEESNGIDNGKSED